MDPTEQRRIQSDHTDASVVITLIASYMGPIWGRQDPGEPHVGPMNFAIWDSIQSERTNAS